MTTINLQDAQVNSVLTELHQKSKRDISTALFSLPRLAGFFSANSEKKSKIMGGLYLAVDEEQGSLLYTLARGLDAKNILEFGCSFGISTIYLALAARANGGKVVTTELNAEKCQATRASLTRAGLAEWVEIRQGDAMTTLANYQAGIDFIFLDGWKDLYLPLVKMLEPNFKNGACLVADNTGMPETRPYVEYVRADPRYTSSNWNAGNGATELSFFRV